jgi:hypothetical protein
VAFPGIGAGTFHLAIRHRNHLGVMTANAVSLSNTTTVLDFTASGFNTFGTDARKSVGAVRTMWSGNALPDNRIRYTGSNNDRDAVLVFIGGVVPTNVINNVYAAQDVNMNGNVKYTGSSNDRDPILSNIIGISGSVTSTRLEQLP